MIQRFFQKMWRKHEKRPFSAWQIELTTRCPLKCRMCMRESAMDWRASDMSIEDFRKISPYLEQVEAVVLEGWGEPLLHKNLMDAVRMVKNAGARAGFVTSGWGLSEECSTDLVDAGVDFMGFSLSGAIPKTHNAVRRNSDLESVLAAITGLNKIKKDRGIEIPRLHIVYLMLKENFEEVSLLPELARSVGIEDVVLINLIQVTNTWQEEQRMFACSEGPDETVLEEAEARAKELKIRLRRPSLSPREVAVCDEDPLNNLYISVSGEVAPCVYLYPPTSSPFERVFCGREYSIPTLSFGNVFREPFENIWKSENYVEFRNCFQRRKRQFEELYATVGWDTRRLKERGGSALSAPPEPCRTCHKMLGV